MNQTDTPATETASKQMERLIREFPLQEIVDTLAMWQAAEREGDQEEIQNARNERDHWLELLRSNKETWSKFKLIV